MPRLLRNIEANVLETFNSNIDLVSIAGLVGSEDYFIVYSIEGYVQNFTRVYESEEYTVVGNFGLLINSKEVFEELEISY